MSGPKIFATIRKVDEEKRMVFGRIAQQVVDKSGELLDYAKSKPYFKAWSDEVAKDTDGKSLGNVRAMHGKVAAGVLKAIDFNDPEMAIDVGAHIVDDQEWRKVMSGTYTGFSIGGSYVGDKIAEKMDGKDVIRYTAKPNEVSLVDRPCIQTAKFFEVQKADGSTAQVEFAKADRAKMLEACGMKADDDIDDDKLQAKYDALSEGAEKVETYEVKGTDEDVAHLAKVLNDHNLDLGAVNKFIAEVVAANGGLVLVKVDAADAELAKVEDKNPLRKGVYGCATFSGVLAQLIQLKQSAEYEAYTEGEPPDMAKRIAAVIALAGEVFKEMIDEAVAENYADTEAPASMVTLAEQCGGLTKADFDPLLELVKMGARNSASDKTRIDAIHKASVELGAACSAEKSETVDDLLKADLSTQLTKMVADATAPLQKALDEAALKITKLEAQPVAPTVRLRAVAKGEDFQLDVQQTDPAAPIVDAYGEKHSAAGFIKALHNQGGQPLVKG